MEKALQHEVYTDKLTQNWPSVFNTQKVKRHDRHPYAFSSVQLIEVYKDRYFHSLVLAYTLSWKKHRKKRRRHCYIASKIEAILNYSFSYFRIK